ncbi:MAG: glycoside hydrolase family 3 N-terminal domain-containing protein, partial [Hyphomicrobium sp.]
MRRGPSLFFTFLALAVLPAPPALSTPSPSPTPDRAIEAEIEAKVAALLVQMTLREKIGQLNFPSLAFPYEAQIEGVREGRIGNMLNVVDPRHLAEFKAAGRASRLKIPLILALDAIHSFPIAFPTPIAWAATWRPALAEQAAEMVALETAQGGV